MSLSLRLKDVLKPVTRVKKKRRVPARSGELLRIWGSGETDSESSLLLQGLGFRVQGKEKRFEVVTCLPICTGGCFSVL